MAYEFEAIGWRGFDLERHYGVPTDVDVSEVHQVYVHFFDPVTGDEHWSWVKIEDPLDSWDDWWDFIADDIEGHGYPMV